MSVKNKYKMVVCGYIITFFLMGPGIGATDAKGSNSTDGATSFYEMAYKTAGQIRKTLEQTKEQRKEAIKKGLESSIVKTFIDTEGLLKDLLDTIDVIAKSHDTLIQQNYEGECRHSHVEELSKNKIKEISALMTELQVTVERSVPQEGLGPTNAPHSTQTVTVHVPRGHIKPADRIGVQSLESEPLPNVSYQPIKPVLMNDDEQDSPSK
ncbi:MAG: hypothetical protein NTX76_03760 [Alphaproteobacteria bacterium]|nr:hypothetical protein [Alphaproteobacteria bacterium]